MISVLGAWVYCFRKPVTQDHLETVKKTLRAVQDAIERACGYSSDAVCLAVAMPQSTTPYMDMSHDEWDEICMEHGFEFVDGEAKGRNEYGEPVGVERIVDALKAHDWDGGEGDFDFDEDMGDYAESFDAEEAEMGMELFGMKSALHGANEEDEAAQVEELENMMRRMQAIKGMYHFCCSLPFLKLIIAQTWAKVCLRRSESDSQQKQ